jgi:uncharacterized protein YcaQ
MDPRQARLCGMNDHLSIGEARRIALAAQGFAGLRSAPATRRALARAIKSLGLLQLDSVNVLVRSHYLPLFSRLGGYAMSDLDRLARPGRRRALFEYWGHEASLLPVELQPLLRWRMARAARGQDIYKGMANFARERRDYVERVHAEIAARGPLSAGELSDGGRGRGSWWGWSHGKHALEFLFWAGRVTTAERRGFERVYDLTERVLPPDVLTAPTPDEADAQRALIELSARACGIATEPDLRDYFRLDPADSKARVAELVELGRLRPVTVEGWRDRAYLHGDAAIPRAVTARALLSPFDSLIWMRARIERLFGFHYRLAFYTPAAKRTHGYYVLPFLLDERLTARVDLKADRRRGRLSVLAAHGEPAITAGAVAEALAGELRGMADWLGLPVVHVGRRGDLMPALRVAMRR